MWSRFRRMHLSSISRRHMRGYEIQIQAKEEGAGSSSPSYWRGHSDTWQNDRGLQKHDGCVVHS